MESIDSIFLVYCDCGDGHNLAACFPTVVDAKEFIKLRTPVLKAADEYGELFCFTINEMRIGLPSNFELGSRLQTKIFETDVGNIQLDHEFDRMRALYHHQQDRLRHARMMERMEKDYDAEMERQDKNIESDVEE